MKRPLYFILLLLIPLALLSGCSQDTKSKSEGPVIAEVDGSPIAEGDFIKEISRVPEWAREQFKDDEGKKKFIDELIKRELIYQYAQKMKLNNDADYVSKVEEFKKMTLVSMVLKKEVEEKSNVDDSEVKAFFDQNADKFTIGTKIKASHILVGTEEEAKDIEDRLSKGEKFGTLAKELSKDTGSAPKGGDLGYFGRGQMVPEFEQAALSLKPGEVSAPVKTRFGYHVIMLVDIQKGDPANFEQSKDSIKKQMLGEKRKKVFDSFVDKLKSDAKVSTNDETIAELTLPWEQAAPAPAEAPPATEATEQK
jgi:peptidyl-prolyl cis-trans isomerase C